MKQNLSSHKAYFLVERMDNPVAAHGNRQVELSYEKQQGKGARRDRVASLLWCHLFLSSVWMRLNPTGRLLAIKHISPPFQIEPQCGDYISFYLLIGKIFKIF